MDPVLRFRGITKRFGALTANDAVDLDLFPGEITALLGENGAGKTTLMNILFGHYMAEEGEIQIRGRDGVLGPLPAGRPEAALRAGIGMVHQHFTLAQNLTGFENIVLGTEGLWRPGIGRTRARRRLAELSREVGLEVDLDRPVASLSVGEKQRIEIFKALYRHARILILDEPTAVLTPQEVDSLAETIRALATKGLAIVFISHKMREVLSLAHRIVVLRGGRKVADRPAEGADAGLLAELMVGRPLEAPELTKPELSGYQSAALVKVGAALPGRDRLIDATLQLKEGEIVGIAGVSGNGQGTLAALFAGLVAPTTGVLTIASQRIDRPSPAAMIRHGVGRIPEDRHRDGTVGSLSIAENLALERLRGRSTQKLGFIRRNALRERAERAIVDYDVRCPGPEAPVRLLSGGNIQKVILARVFEGQPRIVVAHQPTRGLDVLATAEVQRRLLEARSRGAAILLIDEDLDQLMALADRIAVLHAGRLTRTYPVAELDQRRIGLMMAGEAVEPVASVELVA